MNPTLLPIGGKLLGRWVVHAILNYTDRIKNEFVLDINPTLKTSDSTPFPL
jgi:hypothetical protein